MEDREKGPNSIKGGTACATGAVMVCATEIPEFNTELSTPVRIGNTTFQYMKGVVVNFRKEFIGEIKPNKMAIVNAVNIFGTGGRAVDGSITRLGVSNLKKDRYASNNTTFFR